LIVGGLQVKNEKTGEFETIEPIPDAFVINLGNMFGKSFALVTFET
jgi:isopenicillin N synthase-like dioxygenase